MRNNAGKFLGAGGYGCVFNPALKCENNEKDDLSKLMLFSEGLSEYEKNMEIKKMLSRIENIDKHFLFCSSWCRPRKVSDIKSRKIRKRCDNEVGEDFEMMGMENLILLLMKNGGLDLDKYIEKIGKLKSVVEKREKIKKLNKKLISMIQDGCIPMNRLGVYHADMKALNLVLKGNGEIKIIDWGLAEIGDPLKYENHYSGIHFNKPYESLLFNIEDRMNEKDLGKAIKKIVLEKKEKIIRSHMKSDMLLMFGGCEGMEDENEYIKNELIKYLEKMAYLCVNNGVYDRRLLINSYYKKQDLWGVMTCYLDICKFIKLPDDIMKDNILNACRYMIGKLELNGEDLIEKLKII